MITAEPIRKVEVKTKSQIATGADVVVETLEAQGVTHVFGVPGAKIDKVFSKSDGWVLFHSESYVEHEGLKATYDPPKQFLPNPLGPGQKWEWSGKDPAQADHTETNRVVGFETVTVAATGINVELDGHS